MDRVVTTVAPVPPYDFDLTAAYATYFRGHYATETFYDGVYRRLLDLGDGLCLVTVRSPGTIDSPALELELSGASLAAGAVAEARRQVTRVLGLDQDLNPFYRMAQQEGALAPLVQGLRGLHVPQTLSVYEALVLAILGQQISAQVAHVLRTLLVQTYGQSREVDGTTYHIFPRPEDLVAAGQEGLRASKLSYRKAQYILDIATKVVSGELDLEALRALPDEEVVRALTGIKGVGVWTAQWLMIRALGRTDGFPHGDLALCRNLGLLLDGKTPLTPEEALSRSRRWAPYRSYVTTYLFAALRSGRMASLAK